MPHFLLKEVPRYECLKEATAGDSESDPSICEVLMNLLHTGDRVSRSEGEFLAGYGLNQARLIVLILLDGAESHSMRSSELADKAKVSRATVTGLIDTMVRAGQVVRAPDPHDRRASNVKLTPAGRALLQKVRPHLTTWSREIFSVLSKPERHQLVKLLTKIQSAVVSPVVP
jgi:DNA-binding MarR family transcriptional regulator